MADAIGPFRHPERNGVKSRDLGVKKYMKQINTDTKIALFKGKEIRKTLHNNEWWFSIIDVVEVLTETDRPRKYWNDLKTKLIREGFIEVSEKIGQLKLKAPDGKLRETDSANTETIFRIIQKLSNLKKSSRGGTIPVIPAKAGIQALLSKWIPLYRGMTVLLLFIIHPTQAHAATKTWSRKGVL